MRLRLSGLLIFLMAGQAQAAEILLKIPDEQFDRLVEETAKWHHFYSDPKHSDVREGESKVDFAVRKFSEEAFPVVTFWRFKSLSDAGIEVEVKR